MFFSDLHLAERPPLSRSQSYPDDIMAKLAEVKEIAATVDVSIFGGDLYHHPRPADTSHRLVRRTIEMLRDWPVPLYVVVGNHDQTPESMAGLGRTALGVVLEALKGTAVQLLGEDKVLTYEDEPAVQLSPGHWTPSIDGDISALMMGPCRFTAVPDFKVKAIHAMVMKAGADHPFRCVVAQDVHPDAHVVLCGHTHWETPAQVINGTLYVGPGSIARTSRSPGELERQVGVTILTLERDAEPRAEFVPLATMRPSADVFQWVENRNVAEAKDSLFEGYVATLETSLDVTGGASIEDGVQVMIDRAPVGVGEIALRYLREAGL